MGLGRTGVTAVLVAALAVIPATQARAQGTAPAATPAPSSKTVSGKGAVSPADLTVAKKHYANGEKKFKAGDFGGALADFEAANDIKAAPQSERYIGLCEDGLGHYLAAVDWYDRFLAHVPDKMAAAADDAKKREGEIKAMPGKVHFESSPAGANVTVDDKPAAGVTPTDVDLPPGPHKVQFSAQDRQPFEKSFEVAFASTQTVTGALEATAPPPPPPVVAPPATATTPAPVALPVSPPAASEPRSLVPAYVTGGLAIAAAGVGTVFGILALNDKSDFDKNPTTSTADNGDTHSLVSDMAFGIAITFGVTSAVLFLTKDEPAVASSAQPASARVEAKAKTPAAQEETARAARPSTNGPSFVATPLVGSHFGGGGFVLRF